SLSTNSADCCAWLVGPGLKRKKTNHLPSGETSVARSCAPKGLVVSLTGSPPSEARTLKMPGCWPPKPQRMRCWSTDQAVQSMSNGAYGICRSVKPAPLGLTIAGLNGKKSPEL